MATRSIVVAEYDPAWPAVFAGLRERLWPAMRGLADAIEHVGSTSVPGLAAKPIIDIDVVVPSAAAIPQAIAALESIGYEHEGDLGIAGREAFREPQEQPKHHLYVCVAGSIPLRNHLTVRELLRRDPSAVAAYARLKMELARRYPRDPDRYTEGKSTFILELLARGAPGLKS